MKNFDTWNTLKKKTNDKKNRFYSEREVWWCLVGVNVGSEQDGSGAMFLRPVLVLTSCGKEICLIVPLTTSTQKHPLRVPVGLVSGKPATAILSQLRVADTKRFVEKVGFLPKEESVNVTSTVGRMFDGAG